MTGSVPFDRDQLAALIDERIGRTRFDFKSGALKAAVRTDYETLADSYRRSLERLASLPTFPGDYLRELAQGGPVSGDTDRPDVVAAGRRGQRGHDPRETADGDAELDRRVAVRIRAAVDRVLHGAAKALEDLAQIVEALRVDVHGLPASRSGEDRLGAPGRGGGVSRGQGKHPGGTR